MLKRAMATFLALVLVLGLSPFGAPALAEMPLGTAVFAGLDDAGVTGGAEANQPQEGAPSDADESQPIDGAADGEEDNGSGEDAVPSGDGVADDGAVSSGQEDTPAEGDDEPDTAEAAPAPAAQPAVLADEPDASDEEPAAEAAPQPRAGVNVINPDARDAAVFAPDTIGKSVTNPSTGVTQSGFVGMVGSLQINVTGNTNVRGKYDTLNGQAVHSSRVGDESALVGYSLEPLNGRNIGGDAATNTNSSSAELVADEGIAVRNIQAAYLVVAATQNYASTGGNTALGHTPLSHYGFCFMGPKGEINRYFPEVIYHDSEKNRAACFFDVTDFVKSQGYGWYSAINIPSGTRDGAAAAGGDYFASWKLIVVEENEDLRPRMLRLLLGGTSLTSGRAATVNIDGVGLSVAKEPTGEIMAAMDGSDIGSSAQSFQYAVNGSGSFTKVENPDKQRTQRYFSNLSIDNKDRLVETSFDPRARLANSGGIETAFPGGKKIHNTDLFVADIVPESSKPTNKVMTLAGGETSVTARVSSTDEPAILTAVGMAVDIVTPVLETKMSVANLTQHYSTSDEGYNPRVNYANEGDTLRVTTVSENVTNDNRYIGLESPVFTVTIDSLKTLNRESITAYFSSAESSNGKDPLVNKKFELDVLRVDKNEDGSFTIEVATNDTTNVITTQGFFEITCTGEAKASTSYKEYVNRASVRGKFVDESATHHDFEMTNLGVATVKSSSDKPSYPLTVTAVGPGKVAGTAKYYSGDAAKISWEADGDAQVVAVFEDSSVRDDLVAQSNPAGRSLPTACTARALAPQADLANSATVTMGSKPKEVIVVFKAKPADDDPSNTPGSDDTQDDTFSVNAIADSGVEGMTDSGTVTAGSNYSVGWSVKPGYRITSIEVDGVAVPFDESTNSIDFSKIGANHTVKVLTQRVATDGSDGTWMVSTTISGPGTISPTTVVKAGSSYKVSWAPQADSTDAVLSLVKVDGKVVYDEYLNNPKTDTDNANNAGMTEIDFNNITGNHSVEVVYRGTAADNTYSQDYVVDTKISGGLGEISPSVTVPESSTSDVTITVTPKDGSTVEALYLQRGSVKQLLENGKDGVVITTDADGKVTVTLPRGLIDSDYTVEAVFTSPGSSSGPGTNPSTSYTITTAIAGGSGGKITATQIGIGAGESRTITWQSDSDRHVTAVMVDGKMRDDLLTAGKVDFSNIRGDHSVVVYVSEKESNSGPGTNPGDKPVNPDNPNGHDPTVPDPTNPEKPGTPGNPGGIPGEKGDEKYLYVNVVTVGPGDASPSVSVRQGGFAEVSWTAAKGHRVKSVTVDGIERLDLMRDLAKGALSFEKMQRDHNVVIVFEEDPDHVPDPDDPNDSDPRPVIDPEQPDSYSLITTEILGGAGTITGNSYNQPGSNRVITWAPAEGYYVKAVYVDGKEVPLTEGMTSYEFTALEGGKHHSVEVRMAPLVPDPEEEPKKPEVVIDKPIDIPPMPGGKVTPEDILDIVKKELGDELPKGTPEVIITKDGKTVDEIDQSVPGTYVIELVYTDEDGNQKVVRLTYVVKGEAGEKGEAASPGRLLPRTGDDLGGVAWGMGAAAVAAAAIAFVARRKIGRL